MAAHKDNSPPTLTVDIALMLIIIGIGYIAVKLSF
jgi:hypothetical protein